MKKLWHIEDWAGNKINVNGKKFATFEDGWEYIYRDLTTLLDLTEDDYQEYYVVQS
jgi:hypothetical protein